MTFFAFKTLVPLVAMAFLAIASCHAADPLAGSSFGRLLRDSSRMLQDDHDHDHDHDDHDHDDHDDESGGGGCFSEISNVFVRGKGSVTMAEAKVGDLVLTSEGTFEPIYSFGHHDPSGVAKFLRIATKRNELEVTEDHLVYLEGKTHPVRAASIKVGDVLQSAMPDDSSMQETLVQRIGMVEKKGAYTPLTPSGKVVVNGVVASSYIALEKTDDEHFHMIGGLFKLSHQDFVHLNLAPFRVFCMGVSSNVCESYNQEGMPHYVGWGMALVKWVHSQNGIIQLLFAAISAAFLFIFVTIEAVFGPSLGPLMVFSLVAAATLSARIRCAVGGTNSDKKM